MKTSESIKNLAGALLRAQKNIGAAVKGAKNPFFKSNYADLGSVMEACKEAYNNEGISILQPVQSDETGDYVETILLHESGEWHSSKMKLMVSKQDMQAYGSAVSYARRYSLQSVGFIPAEDDDGERATERKTEKPKTSQAAALSEIRKELLNVPQSPDVTIVQPSFSSNPPPTGEPTKARTTFRKSAPAATSAAPAETTVHTAVTSSNGTAGQKVNGALNF